MRQAETVGSVLEREKGKGLKDIQPKTAVELFQCMKLIRFVEETIARRYSEQKMRCPTHLSIGQEAVAAGVCLALNRDDQVFGTHLPMPTTLPKEATSRR